jgi:hypothetical protein
MFLSILFSCKEKKKIAEEPQSIVKEWMGKEINFPESIQPTVAGQTVYHFSEPRPYKILVYTDTVGCTSCKLRLDLWKDYIKEADSVSGHQVNFLFYFFPKPTDDLQAILKLDNFKQPIYVDSRDEINKMNSFPKQMLYQCFLLDRDNKVILIGNPTIRPKLWEIYKKQISQSAKTASNHTVGLNAK